VDRIRCWPVYGRSTLRGEFEKKFYLWPFFTTLEYTTPRNPGSGYMIWPLYGQVKTTKSINRWWLPPFFRYAKSEDQWILHAPWPFVQLAKGDLEKQVFWPLYGRKELGTYTKGYYLWPIFWNNTSSFKRYEQHRRYLLPIFAYRSKIGKRDTPDYSEGECFSRYWKIWPLMSWDREKEHRRFRILDPSIFRYTPGVERNWAPWWTLYRYEATADQTTHDLLWGIYKQKRGSDTREWSLLKGILGYKRSGSLHAYQFCFIWFGEKEEQK
jgi:hypothetical protein